MIWFLRGMAFLADGEIIVVKASLRPALAGVAVGALTGVVVSRPIRRQMAGGTIIKTGVVKGHHLPINGAGMAVYAGAGRLREKGAALQPNTGNYNLPADIMVNRSVGQVAGTTFSRVGMDISGLPPIDHIGVA